MGSYLKEACVGNLQEAIIAERNGADRLELCADLHLGGTTPSEELILQAVQQVKIPLRIMIRPRGGDFIYSEDEVSEMRNSIEFCKKAGVEAVVFGILDQENKLDLPRISELARLAQPLKVVIHKAIDLTPDPLEAVRSLCSLPELETVLTSGGQPTAFEGSVVLKRMINLYGDKLEIMPGGKVLDSNVEELHEALGARAYHGKLIVGSLAK